MTHNITDYAFFKKLQDLSYVKRIILYGSRARGDNRERSDIDIAIECPHASEKDWRTIEDIVLHADTLLPIDCIRFDELSETNELKKNIEDQGVILYQKDMYEQ